MWLQLFSTPPKRSNTCARDSSVGRAEDCRGLIQKSLGHRFDSGSRESAVFFIVKLMWLNVSEVCHFTRSDYFLTRMKFCNSEKSCSPRRGIEPRPRRWERRILTTRPSGSANSTEPFCKITRVKLSKILEILFYDFDELKAIEFLIFSSTFID